MKNNKIEIKIPEYGFIQRLATICGCSRHTVRTALYNNAKGKKAEIVRKKYIEIYN